MEQTIVDHSRWPSVQLLGMPACEAPDGGAPRLGHKPLFLLTRLLLETRPVARETMMAFLWPEANEERARGSLRQALHTIRGVTGPACIAADRRSISLRVPPASDLTDFLQAVNHGDWNRAALAYRGPLLEGVTVPDATDAELWLDFQRRRIAKMFETAAVAAMDVATSGSYDHDRLVIARRLRDHDPRQSRFWRYLLRELEATQAGAELRLEKAALGARIESRQIDDAAAAIAMLAEQGLQLAASN